MTRTITIDMSAATVAALKGASNALYVLKAVKYGFRDVPFSPPVVRAKAAVTGYAGGSALVWQVSSDYLARTTVQWDPAVQAFISASQIADQAPVVPGSAVDVALGETVNVDAHGGLTAVSGGGQGAVAIVNQGSRRWTCGLEEGAAGLFAPSCAFPLYGGAMAVLTPLDKVLLMFAADLLPAGAAISTAYSSALLVDAAGADRAVSFDIAAGWSANGATWAMLVPAETNLSPLLITT